MCCIVCYFTDPPLYFASQVLSAVDAHVGASLFENLIVRKLKGKTRVLVMHQLRFLPVQPNENPRPALCSRPLLTP